MLETIQRRLVVDLDGQQVLSLDRAPNPFPSWAVADMLRKAYIASLATFGETETFGRFIEGLAGSVETTIHGAQHLETVRNEMLAGGTSFMFHQLPHTTMLDGLTPQSILQREVINRVGFKPSDSLGILISAKFLEDKDRVLFVDSMGIGGKALRGHSEVMGYQAFTIYQPHVIEKTMVDIQTMGKKYGWTEAMIQRVQTDIRSACESHNSGLPGTRGVIKFLKTHPAILVDWAEATRNNSGGLIRLQANLGLIPSVLKRMGREVKMVGFVTQGVSGIGEVTPDAVKGINPNAHISIQITKPRSVTDLEKIAHKYQWLSGETMTIMDLFALDLLYEQGVELSTIKKGVDPRGIYQPENIKICR